MNFIGLCDIKTKAMRGIQRYMSKKRTFSFNALWHAFFYFNMYNYFYEICEKLLNTIKMLLHFLKTFLYSC